MKTVHELTFEDIQNGRFAELFDKFIKSTQKKIYNIKIDKDTQLYITYEIKYIDK